MTHKAKKHIWPGGLVMAIAVAGFLAMFAVLATSPGVTVAHEADDHDTACAGMTEEERNAHNANETLRANLEGRAPVLCAAPDDTGDTGGGNGGGDTQAPAAAPTTGFVAKAIADRKVELKWTSVPGATSYVIRYRNLDEDGASWITKRVSEGTMYTLEDDDLEDGELYEVQLRGDNQTWEESRMLKVLGPIIQFSPDTLHEGETGERISFELPHATHVKGDMVRYTIMPYLPMGLTYGQKDDDEYVDLATSVHPMITGSVDHPVGGSDQFYRLRGCDVEDSVVDADSCADHIFKIVITPADVKPLADVIRDREYTIGKALDPTHTQNLLPRVGLEDQDDITYQLLDVGNHFDPVEIAGVTFNATTRQLSGTPTGPEGKYRVAYRARQEGEDTFHEARFTITIVEIDRQECLVGLDYEKTQRVYNKMDTVGSANFTVGVNSGIYYVLPIGELGQRGAGEDTTRAFELVTVKAGGDLSAPNANILPDGLGVFKLMVDDASINPLNDLYTRQGPHDPAGDAMMQMMDDEGYYTDPEPDYPDTDNGYRLAIGVSEGSQLAVGNYQSCFIVHDTDEVTGEVDSSAVVFHLNVRPNLRAQDWVIELNGAGDMSELDVDEAFTTDASLLNFEVMYVDQGAARNADTGCIADRAENPNDIVEWSTENDTVTFTAKEVEEDTTQRVQVKASLKDGDSEACVQVRITVLAEPMPTDVTAPSAVEATVVGNDVTVTWTDGDNAVTHMVLLLDSDFALAKPAATNQTDGETMFTDVPAGTYHAVVVAIDAAGEYEYARKSVEVGQ